MKNYSEITVKYLKEKKKRTLFTIVGIIISLSLISGVGFLGLSLKDYMYNLIINDGGDYECSFNGINYKNIKALKYDVDLEKVAVTTYEGVFTDIKNEKVIDKNRFLLRMNDGNYVYINLANMDNLNKYEEIYTTLDENKKGILNLDSTSKGVVFQPFDLIKEKEEKKDELSK